MKPLMIKKVAGGERWVGFYVYDEDLSASSKHCQFWKFEKQKMQQIRKGKSGDVHLEHKYSMGTGFSAHNFHA